MTNPCFAVKLVFVLVVALARLIDHEVKRNIYVYEPHKESFNLLKHYKLLTIFDKTVSRNLNLMNFAGYHF